MITVKVKFRIKQEMQLTKQKVTKIASWQKDSSCVGISNYKKIDAQRNTTDTN